MKKKHIIVADVGGTKTHLAYLDAHQPESVIHEQIAKCADFDSFDALLQAFMSESGCDMDALGALSLALPAPVGGDSVRLTNLPWVIDRHNLIKKYGVEHVFFMNDFEAQALGTLQLESDDCVILNAGAHNLGATRVVVGAGTGLGMAWIQDVDTHPVTRATEGGHIDFAPVNAKQVELLSFLAVKYSHVSYERLLSGQGLVNLYEFFSGQVKNGMDGAWVNDEATQGNTMARDALQMFAEIYGAYVGNLALLYKPEAGIFITGGIAPKIESWMKSRHFIDACLNKGRMQKLVEQTHICLVTNERAGVLGVLSETLKRLGERTK